MKLKNTVCLVISFFFFIKLNSQYVEYRTQIDGEYVTLLIMDGDTMIMTELEKISVKAPKEFEYTDEKEKYLRYKKWAAIVYPYAVQGVRLYKQIEEETKGQSKRERRRFVRSIEKRLEDEFEKPLKNLSRTQGLLLTKMMERNLGKPFFTIIKELKGGFTASYFNEFSKFYGYDLKDGYRVGADPIMDAVLEDFDLNKDLEQWQK
ncbi:MAG: DUF4294 domain-containing protein [Saprospiraceae bacterium]|nr:DUF4294 domain-containing protein [Saprospiraceae bacterium]